MVALLAAIILTAIDDLLGLLQGVLLFGLLGLALLLRWTVLLRFSAVLVAWLRRGFR
jgi:hypothetical protein